MITIGIIGAGVSGLSTAILLQEAGYKVNIYCRERPQQTTSAVAAAIWMPFIAEPRELVNHWSLRSYEIFAHLAATNQQAGVSMVDFCVLPIDEGPLHWEAAVPEGTIRKADLAELPEGYQHGYIARVPMIETPIYLAYLIARFEARGGQLMEKELSALEDVGQNYPVVINCSGLGAKELCNDQEMYPVQGQIVKLAPMEGIRYVSDDDGPNSLAYVLPRKDGIVLGGTAVKGAFDTQVNEAVRTNILERCQRLVPELKKGKVIGSVVGLRPARSSIRLELDSERAVVHNYGHGGSGYTVSWGCAQAATALAIEYIKSQR